MRYAASYTIVFDAPSDAEARSIAFAHHEQLRDTLRIEGADHPIEMTFDSLQTSNREVLQEPHEKSIETD